MSPQLGVLLFEHFKLLDQTFLNFFVFSCFRFFPQFVLSCLGDQFGILYGEVFDLFGHFQVVILCFLEPFSVKVEKTLCDLLHLWVVEHWEKFRTYLLARLELGLGRFFR